MSWLPIVGGLASAWSGYQGAKNQAQAIDATNALEQKRFEYEQAKQQPIVEGAGKLIDYYGSDTDPFSPFVERTAQAAQTAQDVGGSYLSNTLPYQQAGARGVEGIQSLADTASIADHLGQGEAYSNPFLQATLDQGIRDIDIASDRQRRNQAIDSANRGTALSGQAARLAGQIEGERSKQIGDLSTRLRAQAFDTGLDRASQNRAYQQGLGTSLTGLGGTGLQQAVSAQNLASGAGTAGIQAPFQPLNQYGGTLGYAPGIQAPQVQAAPSALGAGLGAGLTAWNAFNKK